jgi:hypothetical protein
MMDKKKLQRLYPWHWVYQLRNSLDFPLRNLISWKRPFPAHKKSDYTLPLSHFPYQIQGRAITLIQQFHLDDLKLPFTDFQLEVNCYYLDVLSQVFSTLKVEWGTTLRVADVGPSDWFYLPALVQFLSYYQTQQAREVTLEGFEIDPYRVYADLHSRYDHAQQQCAAFPAVAYHPRAFQEQAEAFDILIQFFPFLFLKDHLEWGLPRSLFDPEKLFGSLASSLKPGGYWVILNQGDAEHALQKELVADGGLKILTAFEFQSVYKQYEKSHWAMVITK